MQIANTFCRLSLFFSLALVLVVSTVGYGQDAPSPMDFTISMKDTTAGTFHVRFVVRSVKGDSLTLKMPNWTPGYYSLMNYHRSVKNFSASDASGNPLDFEKPNDSSWRVVRKAGEDVVIDYDVVDNKRLFIANSFLDEHRAFIQPTTILMYVDGMIQHPATVTLEPLHQWKDVATGLDPVAGKPYTFVAPDFDVLFDSPIQVGTLDSLPTFEVGGVPHRFIGYELGEFDEQAFVDKLKRLVQAASNVIGDVPYKHYTFIGIGRGQGGLEHINSTAIPFNGADVGKSTWAFIAHEYFHHFNPKRIRPIELGPFDYDNGSRTKMLWVAEGVTVYYEYLILNRAGIINRQELLNYLRSTIVGFENTPGRLHQSATEASLAVWEQGQFGGDRNRTINYYQKGPVLGMLLDFAIRHHSKNERSLDDVMRTLYQRYYKELKRGYTEEEFHAVCEEMAGAELKEVLGYTSSTETINYEKYLGYAGLKMNMPEKVVKEPLKREELENYFHLTPLDNPSKSQRAILHTWAR